MKKILLIGLYGTYNYGCEAIVRGAVEILKHKYQGACTITIATPRVKDDTQRLEGCEISVSLRKINRYKLSNIVRKVLTKVGINFPVVIEDTAQLDGYDAVYSVGGDIYTLDHRGEAPLNFMAFGDYCLKNNIPYSMLCCSIGPFKENRELEKYIVPHLQRITKIYAREYHTIAYLKSIGVEKNVTYLPDPAFQVEKLIFKKERSASVSTIGINLSPLSAVHFYPSLDDAIKIQADNIISIIQSGDYSVKLLPHVKSEDAVDDDFSYLQRIYDLVYQAVGNKVELCSDDVGFIKRKHNIMSCDFIIAARMHCAINAICCNVPTIFLSYSQKAKGMAELIYGNNKFAVDLKGFEDIASIISLYDELPNFRDKVEELQCLSNYKI
ncbi:hypothetical protein JCM19237_3163 [Photobacterium aphoticum]|uniref:Polysaccharide pyruvyl transferase domain-containing protein n=1 Tax=Photobacterium aphoticum TaxID=754436 RepID=A0A090R3G3_9GAMM|nr:hypothetical protein JCM19237_3163 [Photobacterium aphoticum]